MRRAIQTILALLGMILLSAGAATPAKWELQFFHDKDANELTLLDLTFPSALRGIAVGYLMDDRGKVEPRVIITRDGGKNWTYVKIKEPGRTLFFLDDSVGWLVTEKGVWQTEESGQSWKKISKQRGIIRVWFLDENRGFAVGVEKMILETTDGGKHWKKLPVADAANTTAEYTNYTWIDFMDGKRGTIAGYSKLPRSDSEGLPDWMDPERASRRRVLPSSTILVQTWDGGRTWKSETTSTFGRITRFRMSSEGNAIVLVRFEGTTAWQAPSEVFGIELRTNETQRIFREKNRSITDVAIPGDGYTYLAGFEPVGTLPESPIPGRLVILRSRGHKDWEEMETDYRAFARYVVMAAADSDNIWAATDTGMILKLTK